MRIFKTKSLSNCQIRNTVLVIMVTLTMYIISPGLIYLITASLYLLTTFTPFTNVPPPPLFASGHHQSVLGVYELDFLFVFLDFMCKGNHILVFLCLTSFTYHNALKVHVFVLKTRKAAAFMFKC